MPKTLDPNHLALMTAVKDAVDTLRKVNKDIVDAQNYQFRYDLYFFLTRAHEDTTRVIDRLRLTLKGRLD